MKTFDYYDTRYDLPEITVMEAIEHTVCIEAKDAVEADKIYRETTGQRRIPKYIKRRMIPKSETEAAT